MRPRSIGLVASEWSDASTDLNRRVSYPESREGNAGMARTTPQGRRKQLCSFCGKQQDQVQRLIAGPGVFICDECIQLFNEVLAQGEPAPAAPTPSGAIPWWRRVVERWWIHRAMGTVSPRHRSSLA